MEFDKKRYLLFSQSYVATAVAEAIRAKHGISKQQSRLEWLKRTAGDYLSLFDDKWKEIFASEFKRIPEVEKVADMLGLSEVVLMAFVLYGIIPDKPSSRCEIFNASGMFPISHTGTYIRVDETTTNKEILNKLREAKGQIRLVSSKDKKSVAIKKRSGFLDRKRKDISNLDEANIEVYIAVEKNIKKLLKRKANNKGDLSYGKEIVAPAIEQVVGHTMTKERWKDETCSVEIQSVKILGDVYYSMIERYRLPTYKDLKSILRVINS